MADSLLKMIEKASAESKFPDNTPYRSISVADVAAIAEKTNLPIRDIELASLENAILPERYARNQKSLTMADQTTLLNKRICIVGLGGLGGTVCEILARLGIGGMILIDGDVFEDSNLNRQLLSTLDVIGHNKAETAARRIRQINPAVTAVCHKEFLTNETAHRLTGQCDLFIDCLDNLKTRFLLEKISKNIGAPMVSGAVAGSTGQVTTIFPGDPGLSQIYGPFENLPEKGVETSLGTLAFAVSMVANLECAEAVKMLLGKGVPLQNKLLIINPLENLFEIMSLS